MDIYPTSVEYGTFTVAADVDLAGVVQVAFLGKGKAPDADTPWHNAEWLGEPARVRQFRALMVGPAVTPAPPGGVQLTRGQRWAWVLLPDNPEVIVRKAGQVTVH